MQYQHQNELNPLLEEFAMGPLSQANIYVCPMCYEHIKEERELVGTLTP